MNTQMSGSSDGSGSIIRVMDVTSSLGDVTITDSTINALLNVNASNGGVSTAWGVGTNNNATLVRTTISAQANGSSDGLGSLVQALGAESFGSNVMITDSTLNVHLLSSVSNGAAATGWGVLANNGVTANGSTISAEASGTASGAGSRVLALGFQAVNTVTFQGSESYVTAISSVLGSATPISAASIDNASSPLSQCSTDGVNFTNC